ncbi:MAG: peptide-methionine (S)-S-oxide reductase MsrA [Flavobacteriales bacterium]
MKLLASFLFFLFLGNAPTLAQNSESRDSVMQDMDPGPAPGLQKATLGAGCFWCVEAIFQHLEGVEKVISGYAGGHVEAPSYKEVCTTHTGHAEVVRIHFDPSRIRYKELLEVFWQTHDPTQKNRQGADVGSQYRSIILYHDEDQRSEAEHYKAELDVSGAWDAPIVTEIEPCTNFYPAEGDHQDYYRNNQEGGYCRAVIVPKLEKLKEVFGDKLKAEHR